MQISTKGRYALRLMLDLAVHNTGELGQDTKIILLSREKVIYKKNNTR